MKYFFIILLLFPVVVFAQPETLLTGGSWCGKRTYWNDDFSKS